MKVYIGWDQRDLRAYLVCVHSLLKYASGPVKIHPLREFELRQAGLYWRGYRVHDGRSSPMPNGQPVDDKDGKPFSTGFSFTRFLVPTLENHRSEVVMFLDADMMFRHDVYDILDHVDQEHGVWVVKHDYRPPEHSKMDGVLQEVYNRKNWSSAMLMRPSMCNLSPYEVNNLTGSSLHGFTWIEDELIGELPPEWNFLCGHHDPKEIDPKIVHFTRGTPDMGWDEPFSDEWWKNYEEADARILLDY